MKRKKLSKTKLVKELARERIGSPPPSIILPNKKKTQPKYKEEYDQS